MPRIRYSKGIKPLTVKFLALLVLLARRLLLRRSYRNPCKAFRRLMGLIRPSLSCRIFSRTERFCGIPIL